MRPEDVTIEMLEEAFKNHKRKTCKVDCCILCFSEATKEDLDPSAIINIMEYAKDYEAGY